MRLEAFGVVGPAQGEGLGAALLKAFEDEAARRGLRQVRTTALWREHALLAFFDRAGFQLSPVHVLDCALDEAELGSAREAPVEPAPGPADPNDYGTPRPADFAPLARDAVEIGILSQADLEGVARIDRRHTGRDRRGYLCRTVAEALADSALRVSLAEGGVVGKADVAVVALNLHDIYNGFQDQPAGEPAAVAFLKSIHDALKPGGTLALIDHVGVAGQDNKKLHRMQPRQALDAVTKAGFTIEAESKLLASSSDDHTKAVFDPAVRGGTDQFMIRARKSR